MNSSVLHKGIDVLDKFYPSVNTAFITNSYWEKSGKYIQITILHDNFDYKTFETFIDEKIIIEVLVFPKSYLTLVDKHFDFLTEYNLIELISKGILIKDNLNNGENIQQMYEVIKSVMKSVNLPNELNKNLFEISRLINLFEFTKSRNQSFIIKNKLFNKLNETLLCVSMSVSKYNKIIKTLEVSFNDNELFLYEAKEVQNKIGGSVQFYSEDELYNYNRENEIGILISSIIPIDEFISVFLIFLLKKLKKITHKIQLSFKLYEEGKYLINIWTKNATIKNTILPTLNFIYLTNNELYSNFKPKYPFKDKRKSIQDLLLKTDGLKELQILLSSHLLDLKLNANNTLSEGYRVSYGIYIVLEIFLISDISREKAKTISSVLFERWLSLSYETASTNFNDLELQSHKVLNEFENLYLLQLSTLKTNFAEIIQIWEFTEESILGLKILIENFYNHSNKQLMLLETISQNNPDKKKEIILETIIFEIFSSLGIKNYHKAYIIYTINRLLHEA